MFSVENIPHKPIDPLAGSILTGLTFRSETVIAASENGCGSKIDGGGKSKLGWLRSMGLSDHIGPFFHT